MTDSTATKVVSNGDTTEKSTPAPREHGMNRLRELECASVTGLINDCFDEAEHLIRKIHNKVFNRTLDHDGSKGTKPLDYEEAQQVLHEAYQCGSLGLAYICQLRTSLREAVYESEPPF
jgi:hypothetical protein